jgi:hypothetical protein
MSNERNSEFERRVDALLQDSVASVDGATRSRLTQARYAALERASRGAQHSWWRRLVGGDFGRWAPIGALAAVAVLASLLWIGRVDQGDSFETLASGTAAVTFEDLELLADADALELVGEDDPEFYEWALAQASSGEAVGT